MKKKWILLFSVTVCILLIASLWQNVFADGSEKAVPDMDFCNHADSCSYSSLIGKYVKMDYNGGNYCHCYEYGGTLPWCEYTTYGHCYDAYECTGGCTDCAQTADVPEQSCTYPSS